MINKKLARIKRIKGHRRGLYLNLNKKGNIFKYVSITFIFAFLGCMCIRLDIERISVILYILYGIIIPPKNGKFQFRVKPWTLSVMYKCVLMATVFLS